MTKSSVQQTAEPCSTSGLSNLRIDGVDNLLAVAEALEREAAARYRFLAARMSRQGDTEMAAQFDVLATWKTTISARFPTERNHCWATRRDTSAWDLPPNYDEEELRGALLSAYQALAFAVRNEERAFAFYTYVAAEAKHSAVRALAEDLARDELEHASTLRRHRRRAFCSERPAVTVIRKPSKCCARPRENGTEPLPQPMRPSRRRSTGLERARTPRFFDDSPPEEEKAATGAMGAALPKLRSATDGLRILEEAFDRYALIGERSKDEKMVAEAQRLSGEIIARLALAGGARGNTLFQADRD